MLRTAAELEQNAYFWTGYRSSGSEEWTTDRHVEQAFLEDERRRWQYKLGLPTKPPVRLTKYLLSVARYSGWRGRGPEWTPALDRAEATMESMMSAGGRLPDDRCTHALYVGRKSVERLACMPVCNTHDLEVVLSRCHDPEVRAFNLIPRRRLLMSDDLDAAVAMAPPLIGGRLCVVAVCCAAAFEPWSDGVLAVGSRTVRTAFFEPLFLLTFARPMSWPDVLARQNKSWVFIFTVITVCLLTLFRSKI